MGFPGRLGEGQHKSRLSSWVLVGPCRSGLPLSFHIWVLPWPPALLAYSKVMPTSRQQSQASHGHFTSSHHDKTSSAHKSRHGSASWNEPWVISPGRLQWPCLIDGREGSFSLLWKTNSKWWAYLKNLQSSQKISGQFFIVRLFSREATLKDLKLNLTHISW